MMADGGSKGGMFAKVLQKRVVRTKEKVRNYCIWCLKLHSSRLSNWIPDSEQSEGASWGLLQVGVNQVVRRWLFFPRNLIIVATLLRKNMVQMFNFVWILKELIENYPYYAWKLLTLLCFVAAVKFYIYTINNSEHWSICSQWVSEVRSASQSSLSIVSEPRYSLIENQGVNEIFLCCEMLSHLYSREY